MNTPSSRTFPCFAAATPKQSIKNALTHACTIDADGFPVRVLCKRVKLESICADLTQATDEPPTCPACLRAVRPAT